MRQRLIAAVAVALALTLMGGCLVGIEDVDDASNDPEPDAAAGTGGGAGTGGATGNGGTSGSAPDATVDPTALLAHWKLDEGAGSVAEDATGHGHHFQLTAPVWIPGKHGGAIDFDGVSTFGKLDDPPSGALDFDAADDFSVAAWIRTTTVTPTSGDSLRIVSKQEPGGALYFLRETALGTAQFGTRDAALGSVGCTGVTSIADGAWHHLAGIRSKIALTLYVDGVAECVQAASPLDVSTSAPLYLGSYSPSEQHFKGAIDDVRIYGRSLTPSEISTLAAQ